MPNTASLPKEEGFPSELRLRKKLPPGQQSTLKTISMHRAGPACSCASIPRARRKEAACLPFSSRPIQVPVGFALPLRSGLWFPKAHANLLRKVNGTDFRCRNFMLLDVLSSDLPGFSKWELLHRWAGLQHRTDLGSSKDRHSPGSPAAGGETIFSFLETSGLHLYSIKIQTNNKICPSHSLTNVNGVKWRIIRYWALWSLQLHNSPQSLLDGYYK